ncbi:MAG TPA: sigma-70 family RNA polymerase sigma factor [Steroidobacteraceae bacterium]|jgi:RNA polymerase sigma-70 factor (ECF subfamily)
MLAAEAVLGRLMEGGRAASDGLDWDALYADQAPRVYNFFRFRLGSQSEVEDLTARTFEKAWRSRATYRSELAAFSTWLFTIARNVAIDHMAARRLHLPLDDAAHVAAEGTPEQEVERGSDLARLALLTAGLPERERELIALKYGAGLDNRLISRLTGLSESNVGTILHRTVRALRAQWFADEAADHE